MTTAPPPAPTPSYPDPAAPEGTKPQRNILGIVSLCVAAVGFIFACIPGALIVGWVLLPISFILGIVALFQKGKAKWPGITAIIVSVVGTIVGVIVFTVVVVASVDSALDEAFGGSEVEVGESVTSEEETEGSGDEGEEAAKVGTRENPIPLGVEFSSSDWSVVVNSVTLDAADQILAANEFNDAPDEGTEYILINYTTTYIGDDADGDMPAWVSVDYVTADGVTVDQLEKLIMAPDEFNSGSTLYSGAAATGNRAVQVPSPADGVLAITPGLTADKVFVAIK